MKYYIKSLVNTGRVWYMAQGDGLTTCRKDAYLFDTTLEEEARTIREARNSLGAKLYPIPSSQAEIRAALHISTCTCIHCTNAAVEAEAEHDFEQEAKAECLRELAVLANMGNADPEATGCLAIRALEKYMNAIGQTEVMAAYNSVARY